MTVPGFTADATLDARAGSDHRRPGLPREGGIVVPQAPQFWCIATIDGGRWCCIRGSKGPICWKIPPPIVIAT